MANPVIGAHSLFDTHTVTCSPTEDATYPLSRVYDDRSYAQFKPGSADTTVDIITDAGSGNTGDVNYLAILNHDLSQPQASGAACTWTFARSTDGVSYTTIQTATPTDNRIIFRKFSSTHSYRFFRLRITRGASFIPSIGEIQWGTSVDFPYSVEFPFDPQEESIEGQLNRSQTGKIIGAIRKHVTRENRIRIPLVLDSFVRGTTVGNFGEFWTNYGKVLKPFFFAWNPGDAGDYETDAYWAVVKPSFDLRRPIVTPLASGYRDIEFTIEGESE